MAAGDLRQLDSAGREQLKSDGAVNLSATGTPCCCTPACPTVCSDCPTTYALTVANVVNSGLPNCCCSENNGTFTLTQHEILDCIWESEDVFAAACDDGGTCDFHFRLRCTTLECGTGAAGARRWIIEIITSNSTTPLIAEMVSNDACPPTGFYTVCSTLCGGAITVELS